jgi:hypothetical protein
MDNFARRRDAAEEITINGARILRKVTCSVSDHFSMAAVASTTYFAYHPNRFYVEELLVAKRIDT